MSPGELTSDLARSEDSDFTCPAARWDRQGHMVASCSRPWDAHRWHLDRDTGARWKAVTAFDG